MSRTPPLPAQPIDAFQPFAYPDGQHPVETYLGRLASGGSRRTMDGALERIASIAAGLEAREMPWHELRYPHTAAIRSTLADVYAPAGANLRLAALRGVLRECWRLGFMEAEEFHRAIDLPTIRGNSAVRGRALSRDEVRALFQDCADDPYAKGARDAAIFAVGFGGGLRRAEIVGLNVDDYEPKRRQVRVRGKGRKHRLVPLPATVMAALDDWLGVREAEEAGPLFTRLGRHSGEVSSERLTEQAVYRICELRGASAGIDHFSPHDFRRTYISELLDLGVDVVRVARMAGHSGVATTARYDRRADRAGHEAAGRLSIPYVEHPGEDD